MSQAGRRVEYSHLPYAEDFLVRCARAIVAERLGDLPDLSGCTILLPNPALAPLLRGALAREAGRALLLPRMLTAGDLARSFAASGASEPDSVRQIRLYRVLRERDWLPQAALWQISGELLQLFDELTERAIGLPAGEAELLSRLAQAYAVPALAPLRFEAQLVHRLWSAESRGRPAGAAARALALAAAAEAAPAPLFALCDGEPGAAEAMFLDAWAAHRPVRAFVPVRRHAELPLPAFLDLAWPAAGSDGEALALRAERARGSIPQSPLQGRLDLVGCTSLEEEAGAVAAAVRRWVSAGKRRIALIAADRATARRARAMLERDGILVRDETGWKLSTTRAAALLDVWLECLAADAWHRDLLDMVKSPFVFSDWPDAERQSAVLQLEGGIARYNLSSRLDRYEKVLGRDPACAAAVRALARIREASAVMPLAPAPAERWIERLEAALTLLGADAALSRDAAGRALLDLLRERRDELAGTGLRLEFGEWRAWLDREMENASFVDAGIDSPIVMTHLAAARLRTFEAAIVIGADREHLAAHPPQAVFCSQAVRAELGLATTADLVARLRDSLAFLLIGCAEVVATWQQLRNEEENPLCAEFAVLALLQRQAYGCDLVRTARVHRPGPAPGSGTARPAPAVAAESIPLRLPVSALAGLVACPYQFFVRRVLGLAESDEVREALEKRDYGEVVHRILLRFHSAREGAQQADGAALLDAISSEVFAPYLAANFFDHAWQARWRAHAAGYLDWQGRREEAGWRFVAGEAKRERRFRLDDGAEVRLEGRLDRIDRRGDGAEAVLDYKVQGRPALRKKMAAAGEDVQLAAYVLLQGEQVVEAAYVALDDEHPGEVGLAGAQDIAAMQARRLTTLFSALRAGAGLPAHGAAAVCTWCEARGLCRRDYHAATSEVP